MPEREDTRPIKVEVRNLTKRFGDLLVLDDMSFNIRKGEFVCVVGPTGCGKTTFLNCLTRIHMPSEGDLYIDGVPADPRKHNISFVFQEPSALPWLTVEDNLAYGLKIKRIPKAEIDRRVNQMMILCSADTDSSSGVQEDLSGRAVRIGGAENHHRTFLCHAARPAADG